MQLVLVWLTLADRTAGNPAQLRALNQDLISDIGLANGQTLVVAMASGSTYFVELVRPDGSLNTDNLKALNLGGLT